MRNRFLVLLLCTLAACSSPPPETISPSRAFAPATARFGDADPHDWLDVTPWHYPVHGIDVSKYQGEIDWHRVRASGAAFAFIKATEGGDHIDDRFAANWSAAAHAGVARGAYHYYYFCRPAAEQAAWFVRHVPRDPYALPPVLDMEWNHRSRTCPLRPHPQVVRSEMGAFLASVGRHYGKRPIIYTTVDFYRDNELWRVQGYEFWLRSVAGHPADVYPDQDWRFWQYTGTGIVPGVAGDTDINVFGGSYSEWQQWLASRTL